MNKTFHYKKDSQVFRAIILEKIKYAFFKKTYSTVLSRIAGQENFIKVLRKNWRWNAFSEKILTEQTYLLTSP